MTESWVIVCRRDGRAGNGIQCVGAKWSRGSSTSEQKTIHSPSSGSPHQAATLYYFWCNTTCLTGTNWHWSATGLAPGLLLNPQTGDITGTPTASSAGTVSVTVTDQGGQTASAQFPFSVAPPRP